MTPRELLFPRYKLKMDYPGNLMPVGHIWTHYPHWDNRFPTLMMDHYPNVFKKLRWWEERGNTELPKYVRHVSIGEVRPVTDWHPFDVNVVVFDRDNTDEGVCASMNWPYDQLLPATEEEYEEYQLSIYNSLKR